MMRAVHSCSRITRKSLPAFLAEVVLEGRTLLRDIERRETMRSTIFAAAATALILTGCPKDKAGENDGPMTQGEAKEALEEATVDSQAAALTTSSVEITTNFTIGKAVTAAAAELKTFIESQLPCAEITLADATLSVSYGAKPGNCVYRGNTFTGQHIVKVQKNEDEIIVDHEWKELSNGKVKVTGTAHVTWDFDDKTRRVEHSLTWTRIADGRTGTGTGDITMRPLSGGVTEGLQVDGSRAWEGAKGKWNLAVEGVQARWADPVPQAGIYRLASPKNRSLSLSFRRVDGDTIEVTLKNDKNEFKFNVNSAGSVNDKS
jgi:hypothetical protein